MRKALPHVRGSEQMLYYWWVAKRMPLHLQKLPLV
jgi:hypothetical protein